jgi:hypothetical protein
MIKDGKYFMDGAFKDNIHTSMDGWRQSIERVINTPRPLYGPTMFVQWGGSFHLTYLKMKRDARKKTTAYKLYKVRQAFRVLVKLCFREWFKIKL